MEIEGTCENITDRQYTDRQNREDCEFNFQI